MKKLAMIIAPLAGLAMPPVISAECQMFVEASPWAPEVAPMPPKKPVRDV